LALLVLGEVERGLYGAFIVDIVQEKGADFFSTFSDTPKSLGSWLAKEFLKWTTVKARTTSDEVFRMCLYFMKLTRQYKLFRLSVRNGDAVLVEYLYEYFIPIWIMTGKHNYVEIGLNQIEDLYGRVPFHVLQAARENRMQPIHTGTDRDGKPMAHWALDALMELLQIKYKAMNFPNSREGWQNHSTNMPMVSRARTFCETEYSRRYDVDAYDEQFLEFQAAGENQDKGNKKSQSKIPKRHLEKIMVSEILLLADAFTEIPDRKMSEDLFWKVLKNVTTSLDRNDDTEENGDLTEGRSHAEHALVTVNREMMQNNPLQSETSEEVADASELDQLAWFNRMEEEDAALFDSDEEEEYEPPSEDSSSLRLGEASEEASEDIAASGSVNTRPESATNGVEASVSATTRSGSATNGVEVSDSVTTTTTTTGASVVPAATPVATPITAHHIVADEGETEVIIGTSNKKVKVRKAKLNRLGLRDVYNEGRLKMEAMKIPEVRFRRRCRIRREINTLQKELDCYLSNKDGSAKMKELRSKLDTSSINASSDLRVEYRLMKKNLWIAPTGD
jgi:hypothetical protein